MGIYIHCSGCKCDFDLNSKKCPNCSKPVPREGKNYRIIVMVSGKRVSKIVPNSLSSAKQIESKLRTQMVEGTFFSQPKKKYKLNEVWEKYLELYKATGKAWKKERNRYDNMLRNQFGSRAIDSITSAEVEKYMIALSSTINAYNRPYSPKSIKNTIDLLSLLFNYAKKMKLHQGENPCECVKRPRINNEVMNVLSIEEIKRFIKFLDNHHDRCMANLIKFLIYRGVRLGEALKLRFADIDFERGVMLLRDPKCGKDQHVFLNKNAITVLKDQFDHKHPSTDLVFPNKKGQQRAAIKYQLTQIKIMAGIPMKFRCHDFRHQYASLLASSGKVDPYLVQKLMNHSQFQTTQRYAHLFSNTIKSGAGVIDDILEDEDNKEEI